MIFKRKDMGIHGEKEGVFKCLSSNYFREWWKNGAEGHVILTIFEIIIFPRSVILFLGFAMISSSGIPISWSFFSCAIYRT